MWELKIQITMTSEHHVSCIFCPLSRHHTRHCQKWESSSRGPSPIVCVVRNSLVKTRASTPDSLKFMCKNTSSLSMHWLSLNTLSWWMLNEHSCKFLSFRNKNVLVLSSNNITYYCYADDTKPNLFLSSWQYTVWCIHLWLPHWHLSMDACPLPQVQSWQTWTALLSVLLLPSFYHY